MLIDGLEWCGLLMDYCDVLISCLDWILTADGEGYQEMLHAIFNHFISVSMKVRCIRTYAQLQVHGSNMNLSYQQMK